MILKDAKPRPDYYSSKEEVRYALIPTRLKRAPDDKTGEIIWLEKYVKIYKHERKSKNTWSFDQSLRLSVHVLNKLESQNDAGCEVLPDTNYSPTASFLREAQANE